MMFYILYILRNIHGIKGLKVKRKINEKDLMEYKLIKRGGGLAEKIRFSLRKLRKFVIPSL